MQRILMNILHKHYLKLLVLLSCTLVYITYTGFFSTSKERMYQVIPPDNQPAYRKPGADLYIDNVASFIANKNHVIEETLIFRAAPNGQLTLHMNASNGVVIDSPQREWHITLNGEAIEIPVRFYAVSDSIESLLFYGEINRDGVVQSRSLGVAIIPSEIGNTRNSQEGTKVHTLNAKSTDQLLNKDAPGTDQPQFIRLPARENISTHTK